MTSFVPNIYDITTPHTSDFMIQEDAGSKHMPKVFLSPSRCAPEKKLFSLQEEVKVKRQQQQQEETNC